MSSSAAQRNQRGNNLRRTVWLGSRLVIMVVTLGMVCAYAWAHRSGVSPLAEVRLPILVIALILDALIYVWIALWIQGLVWPFNVRIGVYEAWLLSMATRFGNLFLPFRGGAGVRAVYLKRVHGLSYTHFLAGLAGTLVGTLLVSTVISLGGLIWLAAAGAPGMATSIGVLAWMAALLILLTVRPPRLRDPRRGLTRAVSRVLTGWRTISRNRRAITVLLLMNVAHVLTLSAIYALLLEDFDVHISWSILLVIVALGNVNAAFVITPGNVGVYEGLMAVIGRMVGVAPVTILGVVLIWRALDTALVLMAGWVCGSLLTRRALRKPGG